MNRDRRRTRAVVTWTVVVAWVGFYVVAVVASDGDVAPEAAALQLVLPPGLWAIAVRLLLRHLWAAADARTPVPDPPEQVLAAAVAALPERRRDWGRAMTAELAGIRGRSARWRFALSSARAALSQPPAGGWPLTALAVATVPVVGSVAATGPAVGAAVPGLRVFAVTFAGLIGASVLLAVARRHRPRLPAPAASVLVTGAVAASIAGTVVILRRDPAAADHLPPAAAVYLAVVLAGCLWIALAAPRSLGTDRRAPHLGAVGGLAFAGWFLLVFGLEGSQPPALLALLIGLSLVLAPFSIFFAPAFVAGRAGRSFRSGLQAAVWTLVAVMPTTYALWLPLGIRRHGIDGRSLDGEVVGPVGMNLADAMVFCLGVFPVLGLLFGLIGAGVGARPTGTPDVTEPQPQT
jgi:hypothetical protein